MTSLWIDAHPLVLASQSPARRALLARTGIPFETMTADIDERAAEAPLVGTGATAGAVAAHLAAAKAMAISATRPDRLVVGADQTLALDGRRFSKPRSADEAKTQLAAFSGRTHELHSGICVVRDGRVLFHDAPVARLSCRTLSPAFIDAYVASAGEAVLASVGGYQVEGLGIHLFERVEGDQATIMGLPLIPLLGFLRAEGCLLG
jgi:septum formation protein